MERMRMLKDSLQEKGFAQLNDEQMCFFDLVIDLSFESINWLLFI